MQQIKRPGLSISCPACQQNPDALRADSFYDFAYRLYDIRVDNMENDVQQGMEGLT